MTNSTSYGSLTGDPLSTTTIGSLTNSGSLSTTIGAIGSSITQPYSLSTSGYGSWTNNMATATATSASATSYTYNLSDSYITANSYGYNQTIRVSGDATFDGEVTIKGVSLSERLDSIEERLGILRPNNDLEGKWEQLKSLGEEYRKLEKEILEKEAMWDILKK